MTKIRIDETYSPMRFGLFPTGYGYTGMLGKAKTGDTVQFLNGGESVIKRICRMRINEPATDALCKLRYGVPIVRKHSEWRRDAVYLGNKATAVSTEFCMLVTYGDTVAY